VTVIPWGVTSGLRLTGLVGKGAIPWAKVGFGAFCFSVLSRLLCVVRLGRSGKKEVPLAKKTQISVFAVSLLEVVSGTGASIAASALLA
jgi:hypothetical protein